MKTVTIVIGSHVPGIADQEGKMAVCENCNGQLWRVFQIEGQDHPHYECGKCGMSQCSQASACHLQNQ